MDSIIYLEFKDGGVDGFGTVAFKTPDDGVEDLLSDGHLFWIVIPGPLHTHTTSFHQYNTDPKSNIPWTELSSSTAQNEQMPILINLSDEYNKVKHPSIHTLAVLRTNVCLASSPPS